MSKIIEKLKNEKIEMRPGWYFAVKSILLISLTVLALFLTLFLASYLLFYLKRSGVYFASLPLVMFLLMIVFVAIVEILVNRYAIAYRKPVIYSLLIVIALIIAMGMAVDKARFHERVEKRNLPMIKKMYKTPPRKPIRRNLEINIRKGF